MEAYGPDHIPRRALAIFAHPDDAEFTVAGTIAKWTNGGCEVTLVLVTSGNAGTHDPRYSRAELAKVREDESREAARLLGVKNLVFLRHDDCTLVPTLELRRELVREIRRHRPEVLICGDPQVWFHEDRYINHPDHRAAAAAALEAVFPCAEMELLWPEEGPPHKVQAVYIGSTTAPNVRIDISGTLEVKIAALKAHKSQLLERDPSPMIRAWARNEASGGRPGGTGAARGRTFSGANGYAESFRVMKLRERGKPLQEEKE
jgi:LmbE family N-acetylglucosaminyl deacetylase